MSAHLNAILDSSYNKEIKRGDIFWANIPHDSQNRHAQHGTRPVIVISNDMCNKHSPAIIVLPLTTQSDKYYYIHPPIVGQDGRKSYALTEQPKVLEKDRLGAFVRQASASEMVKLDEALLLSLGMISYLERIRELENKVDVLKNKVPEVKIEKEIVEVPRDIDEDALNIGTHVKGILEIMMKTYNAPNDLYDLAVQNTAKEKVEVTSKDDQISNEIKHPIKEVPDILVTPSETKAVNLASNGPSKHSNKPVSQIDKFKKRYQTYLNHQSKPEDAEKLDGKSTEVQSGIVSESKPKRDKKGGKVRHWEEYDLSECKERPNARKWTNERIKEFIQDCQSNNMTDTEIAKKYGSAERTVRGYFYKLKERFW